MTQILEIAVPVPLRQTFDFYAPAQQPKVSAGARVLVPFGRRKLIGVVVALKASSHLAPNKIKSVLKVLDDNAVFEADLWQTIQWLSRYYLAPLGEVFQIALPVKLRGEVDLQPSAQIGWKLTEYARSADLNELKRAPLQIAILKDFLKHENLPLETLKKRSSGWRQAVNALVDKGWLEQISIAPRLFNAPDKPHKARQFSLNEEQSFASQALCHSIDQQCFSCSLLFGVTGSGKTEVYFAAMQAVIESGQQVLYLVPEIGLTPQLIERVERQFGNQVACLHSAMTDTQRHLSWWHARYNEAKIIIGTRSAVFCSFAKLGLIVVDEEHDASFKQQEGVRYHARDVAVYRAKQANIPIILGSATPSLETYHNALSKRYQLFELTKRASSTGLPTIGLIDTQQTPLDEGLSPALRDAIRSTLDKGRQSLIFINRRGFAPVIFCADCRSIARCHRCDSNITYHKKSNKQRCHHCGYESAAVSQCGQCQSSNLAHVGEGTQRVEQALRTQYPDAKILRLDRDSTSAKGALQEKLSIAQAGEADILLGTQILTKGHDFPNVDLVGVLNADQGLYSTDFRASEALFQQLLQVAGRAGRRQDVGSVLVQTAFADHWFFEKLQRHAYQEFADQLLEQRKAVSFPPYGYFSLLRAESVHQARAMQFLRTLKVACPNIEGLSVNDVVAAPMERRAGRYRAQLLLHASSRAALHAGLSACLKHIEEVDGIKKLAAQVRWSLDVDPIDLY